VPGGRGASPRVASLQCGGTEGADPVAAVPGAEPGSRDLLDTHGQDELRSSTGTQPLGPAERAEH